MASSSRLKSGRGRMQEIDVSHAELSPGVSAVLTHQNTPIQVARARYRTGAPVQLSRSRYAALPAGSAVRGTHIDALRRNSGPAQVRLEPGKATEGWAEFLTKAGIDKDTLSSSIDHQHVGRDLDHWLHEEADER